MPPKYFADTWFFVALADRRDSHHARARRIASSIGSGVVTHDHVFAEVLAYFSEEGASARGRAVALIRDALRTAQVITPDRDLFLRALDRYAARPDKEYSLVDCMSMVMMEDRGIHHVLTNDHHFTQAGFTVVNE